jgi:hypothetical protein
MNSLDTKYVHNATFAAGVLFQSKWKVQILCGMRTGPVRLGQLARLIPAASKKMLEEFRVAGRELEGAFYTEQQLRLFAETLQMRLAIGHTNRYVLAFSRPYGRNSHWFAQTIGRMRRFPAWQT